MRTFLVATAVSLVALTALPAPGAAAARPAGAAPDDKLRPGQLIVCSRGAESAVAIEALATTGDTPNAGATELIVPGDSCRTIVTVPDGAYPIDGTYRLQLEGVKERPPACEAPTGSTECRLPFHHLEVSHAARPGVTDIDQPEVTVTISSLDGVRVTFVHRADYGPTDRHRDPLG